MDRTWGLDTPSSMWEGLLHISWIIKARHQALELTQVNAGSDKVVFRAGGSQWWGTGAWAVLPGGWRKTVYQTTDGKHLGCQDQHRQHRALMRREDQGHQEKLGQNCPILEEGVCLQGLPGCSPAACAIWGLSRSSSMLTKS